MPKYPHLVFDLTKTTGGVYVLVFLFSKLLKSADPPISDDDYKEILSYATSLNKEHLLEVIKETVTVIEDTADGSNAAVEALASPIDLQEK